MNAFNTDIEPLFMFDQRTMSWIVVMNGREQFRVQDEEVIEFVKEREDYPWMQQAGCYIGAMAFAKALESPSKMRMLKFILDIS